MFKKIVKSNGKKNKGGRPKKEFKEEYIDQALIVCRDLGGKEEHLCQMFNVSQPTLRKWQYENPEFFSAIKTGKDLYDNEIVEKSLLMRAVGFEVEEVTTEDVRIKTKYKDDVRLPATKVKRTKKFIPGDVSALFFWLQNRNPNRWRNTKYLQISGKTESTVNHKMKLEVLRNLPKEDLAKMASIYDKAKSSNKKVERALTI